MKPKSQKSINFIQELHKHIVRSPLLRQKVQNKNESQIQTELRPIIFNYMVNTFSKSELEKSREWCEKILLLGRTRGQTHKNRD